MMLVALPSIALQVPSARDGCGSAQRLATIGISHRRVLIMFME
jgi:hypothetical protein